MKNFINCSIKGFILFSLIALIMLMPSCVGIVLFEAPDTAQSGSSIYVKVRVKTDVYARYGFSVAFVLSYDQIYDNQDLKLTTVRNDIPIEAHQYRDIGTYVTIPNNYYAGKYYLLAIPYENDYSNLAVYLSQQNVFYKPITITGSPNYGSDLVTTNVHVYSPVTIDERLTDRSFTQIITLKDQVRFVFSLENRGLSTANASSLYFYFYDSSLNRWYFLGATSTPALGSNGRWEGTVFADFRGRGLSSTTYRLFIFTDFNNSVLETREDNNVYTNWASIRVPNALQNDDAELLTVSSKNAINKALIAAKIEGIDVLSSTSTNESGDSELNKADKIADTPSVFTLFPNPSSEKVTVSFHQEKKSDVIIQLFDSAGKNINSVALSQVEAGQYQQEIPLKGLSKGVYIVKCTSGQKVFTQKLVVN